MFNIQGQQTPSLQKKGNGDEVKEGDWGKAGKKAFKAAVMSAAKIGAYSMDRKKKREAALAQGRRETLQKKAVGSSGSSASGI